MDTIVTRVNQSSLQVHDLSHQLWSIHHLVIGVPQDVLGLLSTMDFATQTASTRHVDTMVTIVTNQKLTSLSPFQRYPDPLQSYLVMTAVPQGVLGHLSTMDFATQTASTRNVDTMVTIATNQKLASLSPFPSYQQNRKKNSVLQVVLGSPSMTAFATQNATATNVDSMGMIATTKLKSRLGQAQHQKFLVMTAVPLDVLGQLSTMEFVTKHATTRNVEMMATIATL